jgi:Ca2+-binding EF-hand superfamily protein
MARWIGKLLVVLTIGWCLSGVQAQDGAKNGKLDADAIFKKLDTNNDGRLSKDEFLKIADRFKEPEKMRQRLTKRYEEIDPTRMGISREQFRKYIESIEKLENGKKKEMMS